MTKIGLIILSVFILSHSCESLVVNCNFIYISYGTLGTQYTCETTNVDLLSGDIVNGVTGSHLSGKSDANVTLIWILGNETLSFFPRGFTKFFPNIQSYYIRNGAFATLYGDELNEFGVNMKNFIISSSTLTTISSSLFDATPNVRKVSFGSNRLTKVGRDLFSSINVSQLLEVYFIYNPCISLNANNQTAIQNLIIDLKNKCPYHDEILLTTTTKPYEKCFDGEIDEFVCDLNENVEEIQTNLKNTAEDLNEAKIIIERLENELGTAQTELRYTMEIVQRLDGDLMAKDQRLNDQDKKISDQEGRLERLEFEVLRLTTNPCTCK